MKDFRFHHCPVGDGNIPSHGRQFRPSFRGQPAGPGDGQPVEGLLLEGGRCGGHAVQHQVHHQSSGPLLHHLQAQRRRVVAEWSAVRRQGQGRAENQGQGQEREKKIFPQGESMVKETPVTVVETGGSAGFRGRTHVGLIMKM